MTKQSNVHLKKDLKNMMSWKILKEQYSVIKPQKVTTMHIGTTMNYNMLMVVNFPYSIMVSQGEAFRIFCKAF